MSVTRALHRAPISSASIMGDMSDIGVRPTVCNADISRDDLTGWMLGQYELGRKIGGGGMGCVFAARHTRLDRPVAIKFIAADVARLPEAGDRFDLETKALGKLEHPNIVHAIDAGCAHELKYLVMEYVDGIDLHALIEQRGPLPVSEACDLVRQAATGLAYSHQLGFLHRDIKPNNLILDTAGIVNILDFGLVRNASAKANHTESGEMIGTFDFVAPEQAHDASTVDARSDIYSLGCTLIFLLSGQAPFTGDRYRSAAAKLKGHLFDQPPWLMFPPADVPDGLLAIIKKMIAKSPVDRFDKAQDVVTSLAPWVSLATPRDIPLLNSQANGKRPAVSSSRRRAMSLALAVMVMTPVTLGGLAMNPSKGTISRTDPNPPSAATVTATNPDSSQESLEAAHKQMDTTVPEVTAAETPLTEPPPFHPAPVITKPSTTTVTAIPLEFGRQVPGAKRLPRAFGSSQ